MPEKRETVPKEMRPTYDAIVALTDKVCQEHINEEYAEMCRRLAAALARKRPSPLARGKLEVWACGVVYTIGTINFLYDRTDKPYLPIRELCRLFGVNQNTASAKSLFIKKLFKIHVMEPEWTLPSRMDSNPRAWYIKVNGFIIDTRYASPEIQAEAFMRGLIPYIPKRPKNQDQ